MLCVFWYPRIFHTSFEYRKENHLKRIDISDDVDDTSFRCYLDIDEDCDGNLCFTTYRENVGGIHSNEEKLELRLEEKSNNGFDVYSFQQGEDSKHKIKFVNYYHIFYHHAKSLHHSHEINHEADSFLRPMFIGLDNKLDQSFMNGDEIGLKMVRGDFFSKSILEPDNLAFPYYLYQYERIFKTRYAQRLSKLRYDYLQCKSVEYFLRNRLNDLRSSNNHDKIESQFNKIFCSYRRYLSDYNESYDYSQNGGLDDICFKLLDLLPLVRKKMRGEVKELCENAYIEYTYCKTLLESKYNTLIRKDVKFKSEDLDVLKKETCNKDVKLQLQRKDFLRKMAVNISSAMSYVDDILIVCRDWDTTEVDSSFVKAEDLSKKAGKISMISLVASIISFIVSLIGLIFAIRNIP